MTDRNDAHELVRKAYGSVAKRGPGASSCCGGPAAGDHPVPQSDLGLSCGDPVAFSLLKEGDVVLDLGSGAGKDVFLAAREVGPAGRAIGVDMTKEMVYLARRNAWKFRKATGLGNVEFRLGQIEDLPLDDASVDAVISNCVINLSPDKPRVFREAYRVLRPGGRMVVSDIVLNRPLPPALGADANLYAACIAGAMLREDYLAAVRAAGFGRVEVLTDTPYTASSCCSDPITREAGAALEGAAASITVLATKP